MDYIYEVRPADEQLKGSAITNYKMTIDVVATKVKYITQNGQTILLPMGHRTISFDLRE